MCMDSSCDLNVVPMTSSSSCYIFNQQMPNVQRWVRRDFVSILPCKALYTCNILFTYIISFNPHNNSDTQSKLLPLFYKDYRKLLTKDHTDEWQKWPWHLGYWVSHVSACVCVQPLVLWQKNGTFCLTWWYLKTRSSIPGETISVNTSFSGLSMEERD